MTEKKDTATPPITQASPASIKQPASSGMRGLYWFLGTLAAVGIGVWAIQQGYISLPGEEISAPVSAAPPREDTSLADLQNAFEASNRSVQALQSQVRRLEERVQTLSNAQATPQPAAAQAALPPAVDNSAIAKLEASLTDLNGKLETLQTNYKKQHSVNTARLEAMQVADEIEDDLRTGEAYEQPFQKLRALAEPANMPESPLRTLGAYASKGVSPLSTLIEGFEEAARLAVPISLSAASNPSTADKMRTRLAHIVTIRKIEVDEEDNSDEAQIARAEAELRVGNVDMALTHLEQLSADPKVIFAAWREQANAYLDAREALIQVKAAAMHGEGE